MADTKIRRSLGPTYTGMTCPGCGEPGLMGMLDVKGKPYVTCESCRFRVLGLSLRGVASIRFLGALLRNASVREAWLKEQVAAMADAMAPVQTASMVDAMKGVGSGHAA